jgi:hypothetical protein
MDNLIIFIRVLIIISIAWLPVWLTGKYLKASKTKELIRGLLAAIAILVTGIILFVWFYVAFLQA